MGKQLKLLLKFFSILFLSLLISQTSWGKAKTQKVFVKVAKKQEVFDQFTYPAKVTPKVLAYILAESQGIVTNIRYNLGDRIHKLSTVAQVKNTDPVYEYQAMKLKAPVTGVVSRIFTTEGSLVAKGEKIALITDPKKAKLIIEVASRDLSNFKVGMKGDFTSRNSKKKYPVRIKGISPLIDPATGTATAELEFLSNGKRSIPSGTLGKVSFKTNIHKGFVFPQNVLVYKGNQAQVRVVSAKDNKVTRVPVTLGPKRRGQIEILKGVKEGQYLIERASGFVKEGSIVAIQNLPKKKK